MQIVCKNGNKDEGIINYSLRGVKIIFLNSLLTTKSKVNLLNFKGSYRDNGIGTVDIIINDDSVYIFLTSVGTSK